jgi:hypothetical protein
VSRPFPAPVIDPRGVIEEHIPPLEVGRGELAHPYCPLSQTSLVKSAQAIIKRVSSLMSV